MTGRPNASSGDRRRLGQTVTLYSTLKQLQPGSQRLTIETDRDDQTSFNQMQCKARSTSTSPKLAP